MTKFGLTTLTASALTAAALGLAAPALAAPSGVSSAQDTISSLEAEGYDVVVNRLSSTPLDQANVVSVGRGQSLNPVTSAGGQLYGPVAVTTVYVNVK
jgi:hypothetical protein